jgi:hypothetical protein
MVAANDGSGQRSVGRGRSVSPGWRVGGVVLMFLGVALMSYGAHNIAKTGNCSGTGYTSYGPVPRCGGGEALYIMSLFFVGPLVAIGGWLLARAWGWLWPTFCVGVGVSLITLRNETTVSSGAKAFSFLSSICLFALAAVSVTVSLRKRHRRRNQREAAGPEAAVVASKPAPSQFAPPSRLAPAGARAGTGGAPDAYDKIAKLALLRDTGALTEEEFELQKAKLLATI